MNKVILIGRIAKDPTLSITSGSGIQVSKFAIAVKKQGKQDEVDFIDCTAFNKQAELISENFVKGRRIAITGRLDTNIYEVEGIKRKYIQVIIENFEYVDYKNSDLKQNSNGNNVFNEEDYEDTPFSEAELYGDIY